MENRVTIDGNDYRAFQDHIIVKVDPESYLSRVGLILMNKRPKYRLRTGTIISLGTGLRAKNGNMIAQDVKLGDRVLYNTYSLDTEMKLNEDDEIQFLREIEILAIIHDDEFKLEAF